MALLVVLLAAGCSSSKSIFQPQPRTEAEFHTWAVERYKKMDGHDPDTLQLKIVDKFAKNAAATEKSLGKQLDDDQLIMLLADIGADVALDPKNH